MVDREGRSWGQAKRFEFIEWRLYWLDRLNRRDLEAEFGISTPQASVDIRNYQQAAPGNLKYDPTAKSFVPSETFNPRFLRPSVDRFLLQMRALNSGAIELPETWFPQIPEVAVVPKLTRAVPPDLVKALMRAIRDQMGLTIEYESLTASGVRGRRIGPHAIAYDGHRWHARAWCFEKNEFRDFLFTRIARFEMGERVVVHRERDLSWSTFVSLKLQAHPALPSLQRHTIERDFGMEDGILEIRLRAAMAFYFIKRNNLDIDTLPAERQQFVLANRDSIEKLIDTIRDEAQALARIS